MFANSRKSIPPIRAELSPRLRQIAIPMLVIALAFPAAGGQQSRPASAQAGQAPLAATLGTTPAASLSPEIAPQPATPARIILAGGRLTVSAQNSDLGQIVQEIARITGMSVTGLNGGPRIFGVYGPADPRTILASLLVASGYNFLIVGGDAAPRQLVLTPETKAPPSLAKATSPLPQDEYEEQYTEQDSSDPY